MFDDGTTKDGQTAFGNVAASQTDSAGSNFPAAATGATYKVLAVVCNCGGTATTVVFNSKGSGAGTAISPTFQNGANGGAVLPYNPRGWFKTNKGEALTVTTGAGSTTAILVSYVTV